VRICHHNHSLAKLSSFSCWGYWRFWVIETSKKRTFLKYFWNTIDEFVV